MSSSDVENSANGAHRPNGTWRQKNGGNPLRREPDGHRPSQQHYGQQEAFLRGFMLGLPKIRVLEFGCGYGRHLSYLRELPNVEIHGCDMSPAMITGASEYLADSDFFSRRVRQIAPREPLPYPDGHFDIVYTSEVLAHIAPDDLDDILRELLRVSRAWVLHIENRPVEESRRDNDEQDGCWLHDLPAVYERLGVPEPQLLGSGIDRQAVYFIRKPGGVLAGAFDAPSDLGTVAQQNAEIERLKRRLLETSRELDDARALVSRSSEQMGRSEDSLSAELARAFEAVPLLPRATRATFELTRGLKRLTRGASPPVTWDDRGQPVDLSFVGIATRASVASPVEFVRDAPRVIGICHPDWRGIRAATYSQVDHVLEVPGIISDAQLKRFIAFLADTGAEHLVINGYPPGIDRLVERIWHELPRVRSYFVYHGTPAAAAHELGLVQRMMDLSRLGAIRKVGFLKAGLADYFRTRGYPAEALMNACRIQMRPVRQKAPYENLRIGVFGTGGMHKNVETQLMAALMIPDAEIHVIQKPAIPFERDDELRLRAHGLLPHDRFLNVLGTMDAALYVSLVECYPMTVLESLSHGVLCLTSHTSTIFDEDRELFDALVVTAHDSVAAIARKLAAALERRSELVPRAQDHLVRLNGVAARRFEEFLGG